MSGDVLVTLAQFAGQTVAAAAITDVWQAVRGRGDARKTELAERWLAQTREQLAAIVRDRNRILNYLPL